MSMPWRTEFANVNGGPPKTRRPARWSCPGEGAFTEVPVPLSKVQELRIARCARARGCGWRMSAASGRHRLKRV